MKIGIFKSISKFTPAVDAFCRGVEAHGTAYAQLRYNVPSVDEQYDVLVCCGFEGAFRLKDAGIARNVVVIDACFINDYRIAQYNEMRLSSFTLCYLDDNNRAQYGNDNSPSDRWLLHDYQSLLNKWSGGGYVLLTLQAPWDAVFRTTNTNYDDIAKQITDTGFDLRIRPHPTFKRAVVEGYEMIDLSKESIYESCKNALATVTVTSTTSIDSIFAGTPVVTLDDRCIARSVSMHSINDLKNITYPDVEQWTYNLAYCQWSLEEMANGKAWNYLKPKLQLH